MLDQRGGQWTSRALEEANSQQHSELQEELLPEALCPSAFHWHASKHCFPRVYWLSLLFSRAALCKLQPVCLPCSPSLPGSLLLSFLCPFSCPLLSPSLPLLPSLPVPSAHPADARACLPPSLQGFSNNWLRVVPRTRFGAFARGAKVVLYTKKSGAHLRIIDGGSGYLCEMEPVAHFGLGESGLRVGGGGGSAQ